jgi:long-subunit acyl-CoA synthetase (AMP-forming)
MPRRTVRELDAAASICELFQDTAARHPDRVALRAVGGEPITWRQYAARVRRIAAGLSALGVRRGDTVALMLGNRPEFNLIDAAAQHLGAVPFSIYNTSSAEQITYLFANAENRIVLCEQQFQPVLAEAGGTRLDHVVSVDGGSGCTMTLQELEERGDPAFDLEAEWRLVGRTDVLTLIYTSGTTGPPKGVELTHGNLLTNMAALVELASGSGGIGENDRLVSYLPDAHIVNRYLTHYLPSVSGASVVTVADAKALVAALPEVRPTLFVAVPMFWYKVTAALAAALDDQRGVRGRLARWAVDVGARRARSTAHGKAPGTRLDVENSIAERLVLRKLRERVGLGDVRVAVSGAAPIAAETLEFVLGLGLPVCEAWGMSELSALATVNPPDGIRVGTVGRPAAGVEVKVADDGELLVRSPGLMKGYRNDPEQTAEAIDADGWMHTGDIGSFDDDGYLRILDRKKELIINSGGKNISPSNIENLVKSVCPLVGSVVAIGERRPFIVALVTLDQDAAVAYAEKSGIEATPEMLATRPEVVDTIQRGVDAANAKLSRVEQIKYVEILPEFWQLGGAELTPTAKLKRKPIAEKYASVIDRIYEQARRV